MLQAFKRAVHALMPKERPTALPTLRVVEVQDATALAKDLFFRAFGHPVPTFPRHYVLLCARPGEPEFALGYVHHTLFESSYLAGGLAVDAWKFRTLAAPEQEEIRRRGGMAEWLMTESCRLARPCAAVFAYIGEPRSLTVNTRVGFRSTGHPHLYILPSSMTAQAELAALSARVAALGPF
jgi:hypothetical protein